MIAKDFIKPDAPISVTLKVQDLKELIEDTINMTLGAIKSNNAKEESNWLTPDQVQARLNVTRPTLWKWNKEGYLKATKFGNRVRYRESDVEKVENAEKRRKA